MSCGVESLNIDVIRGKDFSYTVFPENGDGTIMNLSGYTGQGQIRDRDATTTVLLATFSVAITAPPLTGTNLTNAESVGATANHYMVVFSLLPSATDHSVTAIDTALDAKYSPVYDIEGVNGTSRKLIARGSVTFYYDRTHL